MATKKAVLSISGMTCGHCEKTIIKAVTSLKGVKNVTASFPKKKAEVLFDPNVLNENAIKQAVEHEGYKVLSIGDSDKRQPVGKVVPVLLIVLAVYFIAKYTIGFDFVNLIPRIDSTVSLIALFATGLFTSVHCIAMCGGINLSQSVGNAETTENRFKRPLLYNLGRVISYTVIGGIVGGVGSVLFISQTIKGIIMLAAAVFMILMGLSMLGWLPYWLVPRLPKGLSKRANKAKKGKGPLVVGLLNGLLPCGPLQAMQLYALSTGSIITGALSMMLFALGTVPLMLGTGIVFSMLKGRFTRGITRVSAVLVVLIAVVMVFNAGGLFGWNLGLGSDVALAGASVQTAAGSSQGTSSVTSGGYISASVNDGVQTVEATLTSSKYPSIIVQKGVPVKFNIKADDKAINGCNQTVEFPKYNIEKKLVAGDNIIEFTPAESGSITYSCWMGMIRGQIKVVDDLSQAGAVAAAATPDTSSGTTTQQASGGCCSVGGLTPITEDSVAVAEVKDGVQQITVKVNGQGYSPAVLVVKKGVKTKITFAPESLNYCNGKIVFPELGGSLDLSKNELETPFITPTQDFSFTCTMNMLKGYVKVVDDLNNVDIPSIVKEANNYKPSGGRGGCCG